MHNSVYSTYHNNMIAVNFMSVCVCVFIICLGFYWVLWELLVGQQTVFFFTFIAMIIACSVFLYKFYVHVCFFLNEYC